MPLLRRMLAVALALVVVAAGPATTAAAADDGYVEPFDPGRFSAGLPTQPDAVQVRAILGNANRYAVTTWYAGVKNFDAQPQFYLDFRRPRSPQNPTLDSGIEEPNIRPPASEAYALAVSIATGAYDPAATGVSGTTARNIAVRLVASLARAHVANTPGGWGSTPSGAHQSSLWAALAGQAGWMLWDFLSTTDRAYVRRMVEREAGRYIGYPPPYQKNRAGTYQPSHGCDNTAAEENAWNSRVMYLAVAMMPQHSRRSAWSFKADEYAISSFARPADLADATSLRGRPVADWLEGTNVNDDGTLVNHALYHPDYMTTISEAISGSYALALQRKPIPRSVLHGGPQLYDALVDRRWVPAPPPPCPGSPAFRPPGATNPTGTSYVDNSDDVYYPEGNDWGRSRRAHFAELDAMADAFGLDSLVTEKAAGWEQRHAQAALAMQQRPLADGGASDGSTYRQPDEDVYDGREEWVAARAAETWLTKWLRHQGALTVDDGPQQIVVDNTDRGVTVTGSWASLSASNPQVLGVSTRYKGAGGGGSWVRWAPYLSWPRSYAVYAWWVQAPAQATNTPFTIRHGGVTTVVIRNQRDGGGGRWNLIGTYTLGPGDYVQVADNANGIVVADAILLSPR